MKKKFLLVSLLTVIIFLILQINLFGAKTNNADVSIEKDINLKKELNNAKAKVTPATNSPTSKLTPEKYEAYINEVITLVNAERSKKGLHVLKNDRELNRLARLKSEDMRDNNYFATKSPSLGTFTDMLKSNDYQYHIALERIAGGNQTPQEVFDNWMENPQFLESLLKPELNCIGVGYADGKGEYYYYWTMWLVEKPIQIDEVTRSFWEQEVLRLVNIERSSRGLKLLEWDAELAKVARKKSEDMRDQDYFAHQSPTYGSLDEMLKHFKVSYGSAAENIAAGQKTPEDVVLAWMKSEGHRKNILEPSLTHLGVGYADGSGHYYVYWTQLFSNEP